MPQPASVFPHQLRLGDIVTDDQGHEWEVIGYPSVYNQGKSHQVRVKKLVGDHSIKSINFYSAHERVTVKRGRPGGEVAATTSRAPAVSTRVPLPISWTLVNTRTELKRGDTQIWVASRSWR
jgi:hypothetical protein